MSKSENVRNVVRKLHAHNCTNSDSNYSEFCTMRNIVVVEYQEEMLSNIRVRSSHI